MGYAVPSDKDAFTVASDSVIYYDYHTYHNTGLIKDSWNKMITITPNRRIIEGSEVRVKMWLKAHQAAKTVYGRLLFNGVSVADFTKSANTNTWEEFTCDFDSTDWGTDVALEVQTKSQLAGTVAYVKDVSLCGSITQILFY
jgi:hypothetical protein